MARAARRYITGRTAKCRHEPSAARRMGEGFRVRIFAAESRSLPAEKKGVWGNLSPQTVPLAVPKDLRRSRKKQHAVL